MAIDVETRRRCLIYAQAAAHLREAAGALHDLEPDMARQIAAQGAALHEKADQLRRELQELIGGRLHEPDRAIA